MTEAQEQQEMLNWYLKGLVVLGDNFNKHNTIDNDGNTSIPEVLQASAESHLVKILQIMCKMAYGLDCDLKNIGAMILSSDRATDTFPVVARITDNYMDDSIDQICFPSSDNFLSDIIASCKVEKLNVDGLVDLFTKIKVKSPESFGSVAPKSYLAAPILYGDKRCGVVYLYSVDKHIEDYFDKSIIALVGAITGSILWHTLMVNKSKLKKKIN